VDCGGRGGHAIPDRDTGYWDWIDCACIEEGRCPLCGRTDITVGETTGPDVVCNRCPYTDKWTDVEPEVLDGPCACEVLYDSSETYVTLAEIHDCEPCWSKIKQGRGYAYAPELTEQRLSKLGYGDRTSVFKIAHDDRIPRADRVWVLSELLFQRSHDAGCDLGLDFLEQTCPGATLDNELFDQIIAFRRDKTQRKRDELEESTKTASGSLRYAAEMHLNRMSGFYLRAIAFCSNSKPVDQVLNSLANALAITPRAQD
jgi:hypothetical protein